MIMEVAALGQQLAHDHEAGAGGVLGWLGQGYPASFWEQALLDLTIDRVGDLEFLDAVERGIRAERPRVSARYGGRSRGSRWRGDANPQDHDLGRASGLELAELPRAAWWARQRGMSSAISCWMNRMKSSVSVIRRPAGVAGSSASMPSRAALAQRVTAWSCRTDTSYQTSSSTAYTARLDPGTRSRLIMPTSAR